MMAGLVATSVVAAGFVLAGLAALTDIVVPGSSGRTRTAVHLCAGLSSLGFVVAGAIALTGAPVRLPVAALLGWPSGAPGLAVDALSGLFLVISLGVAVPVALVCAAWANRTELGRRRGPGALHCTLLIATVLVLSADDAFVFLFGWELITAVFYLLVNTDRGPQWRAHASVVTAGVSKLGGGALLLGFGLLAAGAKGFEFDQYAALPPSSMRSAAFVLLVVGFAAKVGVMPLHLWMPRGYRAAPGPLRAVMAAVAVNVGFYGMWRTLQLLHAPPGGLAIVVLLLGGLTALVGVAHLVVQTDLLEVIAYSSVENAGLISVGYGIALIGADLDRPELIAVGLLAATLQVVAHALGKSLVFSAAAGIEVAAGTTALDDLRGVGHRMRIAGAGLAVGSLTLAGLPLTVGFVSEWFILEALMQQFRVGTLIYALPLAGAGALVALTVGFGAVGFVRIVGLVVLGPRDDEEVIPRADGGWWAGLAIALLSVACVAVAAIAPLEVRVLATGLAPVAGPEPLAGALKEPWVLQPVYAEFSALSPSWLAVAMPVLLLAVLAVTAAFAGRRLFTVRRVPAWRSATMGVAGEDQYTPFAFANPTRKVLANVLLTRSELSELEEQTDPGRDAGVVRRDAGGAHIGYRSDVVEIVEGYLVRPLGKPLLALVAGARALQNGRLDAYLAYMLLAVLAVLGVVVALA
jgi:hydrogenase-4 component B